MHGDYRTLEVWQKARALAAHVYGITAGFPRSEVFGLTQQMRRAAVSIPSNIAEGQGRRFIRDRIQFLFVARGSLYELETQAGIAGDLEFMTAPATNDILDRIAEVTRLLHGLIRHYMRREK